MSYNDIADMRESKSLRRRLNAAAALAAKGGSSSAVDNWVDTRAWLIAIAAPAWAAAWAAAVAANNPDPGADDAVVSDAMIDAVIVPML